MVFPLHKIRIEAQKSKDGLPNAWQQVTRSEEEDKMNIELS